MAQVLLAVHRSTRLVRQQDFNTRSYLAPVGCCSYASQSYQVYSPCDSPLPTLQNGQLYQPDQFHSNNLKGHSTPTADMFVTRDNGNILRKNTNLQKK